jgi:hypothetical protein
MHVVLLHFLLMKKNFPYDDELDKLVDEVDVVEYMVKEVLYVDYFYLLVS